MEELVERERSFIEDIRPGLTFSPIVDGWSQIRSCAEAVKTYQYADIPYMIGATGDENGAFHCLPPEDPQAFRQSVEARFGTDAQAFLQLIGFWEDPEAAVRAGGWNDMLKPGVFAWADHAAEKADRPPHISVSLYTGAPVITRALIHPASYGMYFRRSPAVGGSCPEWTMISPEPWYDTGQTLPSMAAPMGTDSLCGRPIQRLTGRAWSWVCTSA